MSQSDGSGSQERFSGTVPRSVIAVDRAIGDLRRGQPVVLLGESACAVARSTEFLGEGDFAAMTRVPGGALRIVVTGQRARALGLETDQAVVVFRLSPDIAPITVQALANPESGMPAPELHRTLEADDLATASVQLAKHANLTPAAVLKPLGLPSEEARMWAITRDLLAVQVRQLEHYGAEGDFNLRRVSSAHVPLADAPDARIIAFRPVSGGTEQIAIVVGEPTPDSPVLVRLHSQCFTGDLLGSLRCDCGDQLRGALSAIAEAGSGVLVYLAQEGRGIGLVNKLRAYTLQDEGLDTYAANAVLGFDDDERHYRVAAEILRQLGVTRVRLLTNNPDKIAALTRFGIHVAERVRHRFDPNPQNREYLEAKTRAGAHLP
ncbi:MAG: GTP cyclohydrolase II [Alphaproteobacteria bacterium]|nr:GTP cyclohydrolase II [Alphaproteobacteria bacterium]